MSEQATVNNRIGAVILAAGYSSRMGSFKPGLQIGGKTVIARLIASFYDAGIKDIVVVSGHNREVLKSLIKGFDVTESYNENFPKGMFTSIQAGVRKTDRTLEDSSLYLLTVPCLKKKQYMTLSGRLKMTVHLLFHAAEAKKDTLCISP